jgi:hypothetical protein
MIRRGEEVNLYVSGYNDHRTPQCGVHDITADSLVSIVGVVSWVVGLKTLAESTLRSILLYLEPAFA